MAEIEISLDSVGRIVYDEVVTVFQSIAKIPRNLRIAIIVLLCAAGGFGVAVYGRTAYQKAVHKVRQLTGKPDQAQQETDNLIAAVGKLIALPDGEQPTIATVTDTGKLKDQPFFSKAENGDRLLIYTEARRLILYRSSINKVINVAPLNIGPVQGQKVRVALYNGVGKSGATSPVEDKLKKEIKNIEVVKKENASRADYNGILVVDLTGGNANAALEMAKIVGGKAGALPDGEARPDADLLVIVGK